MSEQRMVKGSEIMDLANLVNAMPDEPWDRHLKPEDLETIKMGVLPTQWYELDFVERLIVAALKVVAKGNMDTVRFLARRSIKELMDGVYKHFLRPGEPHEAIRKYIDLNKSRYNFASTTYEKAGDKSAAVKVMGSGKPGDGADTFLVFLAEQFKELVQANGGAEPDVIYAMDMEGDGFSYNFTVSWK